MKNNGWALADRTMRTLHLYTGFFLAPWMIVYAASAFCLNHHLWFVKQLHISPPEWQVLREVDFAANDSFPQAPPQQARAILRHLNLDGPHRILGQPNDREMVIVRINGGGNCRIIWRRDHSQLVVQQLRPFSLYRLLHFLHFRHGYESAYFAASAWAATVDGVAAAILFWVVSGVYLWIRKYRRRWLGIVSLLAGLLAFGGLVAALCL